MKYVFIIMASIWMFSCARVDQSPRTLLEGESGWIYVDKATGLNDWDDGAIYYCDSSQVKYRCRKATVGRISK